MSAVIDTSGTVRTIRPTLPKIERLTAKDAKEDPEKVARLFNSLVDIIVDLAGRVPAPYIEFEVQMTPAGRYPLQHNFNGPVRVELVNWIADSFGANWFPYLLEVWPVNAGAVVPVSDANTLVVEASSQTSGFGTFRVSPKGV